MPLVALDMPAVELVVLDGTALAFDEVVLVVLVVLDGTSVTFDEVVLVVLDSAGTTSLLGL